MILRTLTATALLALLMNTSPVFSSDLQEEGKDGNQTATTPAPLSPDKSTETTNIDLSETPATAESKKGTDPKKARTCTLL